MDQKLNVVIDNQSAKIEGKDFLKLFGINDWATDVELRFENSGDLRIIYKDPNFQNPQQKFLKENLKRNTLRFILRKSEYFFLQFIVS